jgi:hypothetical protein
MNLLSRGHILSSITFGLIVFFILCPLPVAGIKVMGAKYTGSIAPGSSAVHTMTVGINPDDPPMDLMVTVLGFGQTPEQNSFGLTPEMDTSSYSARTFITVSPKTFHLEPGGSQTVTATIAVPQNVGDGGRYAIINFRNAPIGNGSTAIVTSISIPLLVTISGTPLTMKGMITDVTVAKVVPGQPIKITTTLKNTGNFHYKMKNNISVTDLSGTVVATGGTVALSSLLPSFTANYDSNLVTPLPLGTYTITSTVNLDDGTVLDTKTIPFEIKTTYIAPPEEAFVILSPKSPAVLTSADGRFIINFPAGSVFSDVNVTLKPFSNDNLPSAPQGATLGATSFRVDGLTGLLSKDATLTIKYTSADLDAAGSDVSRLVLARYDDSENKWTILPTTLDKSALTLSTATNRFGIWAVMAASGGVSSTAAGGSKPNGIGLDITVVFITLGLMVVFVGVHRARKR